MGTALTALLQRAIIGHTHFDPAALWNLDLVLHADPHAEASGDEAPH